MADSVTRYTPAMKLDHEYQIRYAALVESAIGEWCRYSDVALILERREALLREAADQLESGTLTSEGCASLAARIREEIGE